MWLTKKTPRFTQPHEKMGTRFNALGRKKNGPISDRVHAHSDTISSTRQQIIYGLTMYNDADSYLLPFFFF